MAVLRHHLGNLLRSGHPKIANHTAMQRVRIIKINHLAHKIRTISRDEVVALNIRLAVEFADQQRVLFRTCLDLECINCPVIG